VSYKYHRGIPRCRISLIKPTINFMKKPDFSMIKVRMFEKVRSFRKKWLQKFTNHYVWAWNLQYHFFSTWSHQLISCLLFYLKYILIFWLRNFFGRSIGDERAWISGNNPESCLKEMLSLFTILVWYKSWSKAGFGIWWILGCHKIKTN